MKKLTILFLFIFNSFGFILNAQVKGVDLDEAKVVVKDTDIEYGKLLKTDNGYMFVFQTTPVGIRNCIRKSIQIVSDNGLDFNDPDVKDELLASYIDGIHDYHNLNRSISVGSSEVWRAWFLENGYSIGLWLGEDFYMITIDPKYN